MATDALRSALAGGVTAGSVGAKSKPFKEQIDILFYVIMKVIFVVVSMAVAWMITNNMAQLYTERVFVDEKNPPHLRNMVLMWALCALTGALFLIFVAYMTELLGIGVSKNMILATSYDVMFAFILAAVLLYGVSSVMYNKKYFSYKDDGLRAIRALRDIINWVATALLILPAGYVLAEYFAKPGGNDIPSLLKR